jgi:hypothetical protein
MYLNGGYQALYYHISHAFRSSCQRMSQSRRCLQVQDVLEQAQLKAQPSVTAGSVQLLSYPQASADYPRMTGKCG